MRTIQDTGFDDTELGASAKAIFDARIAPVLTDADIGIYLMINVETGNFSSGETLYQASTRANQRNQNGRQRYWVQVGYAASVRRNFTPFSRSINGDERRQREE